MPVTSVTRATAVFVDERSGGRHGRHGSGSQSEQRQAEGGEVGPEPLLCQRDMRHPGAGDRPRMRNIEAMASLVAIS